VNLSRSGLGNSDFRVLGVLLHKGPLRVNTIGPKVWLTPGSINIAVDRLEKRAFVKRKYTDDSRVRLVETHGERPCADHQDLSGAHGRGRRAAVVLSKEERLMLFRILKKLGKGRAKSLTAIDE
jgi:MarR family 2-MHQ and catechol resistance regulon transcriptional repressor